MEKIFLQPTSQEITFNPKDSEYLCDSFAFAPIDDRTRHLGNLYLTGQVKNSGEDSTYLLNLLVSLAKREYYHEADTPESDPKLAFDSTLKKLNDVLEDFFSTKGDSSASAKQLDLGLVAIAGEQIHLSKLGKFKALLARNGEVIDILNNIQLFDKDREGSTERFSNIVSGKIKDGDRLFAFCPNRQITAREKSLKTQLVATDQAQFVAVLTGLSESAKAFQCSGLHIDIKKTKSNGPVIKSIYGPSRPGADIEQRIEPDSSLVSLPLSRAELPAPEVAPVFDNAGTKRPVADIAIPAGETSEIKDRQTDNFGTGTHIVSAEISLARRPNLFARLANIANLPRNNNIQLARLRPYWPSLLLILIVVAGGGFGLRAWLKSDPNQAVVQAATTNLGQAQGYLSSNEPAKARALLSASLSSFLTVRQASSKVVAVKQEITTLLDKIDLVDPQTPALFKNLDQPATKLSADGNLFALGDAGKLLKITADNISAVGTLAMTSPQISFLNGNRFAAFNGNDQLEVINVDNAKSFTNHLKEPTTAKAAYLYQDNLYLLSDNAIYKYTDATTGGDKPQTWLAGLASDNPQVLAVDGNVYVVTASGTVITYFKNKELSRGESGLNLNSPTKLLTTKASQNLYLVEFDKLRIRVISKANGSLVATYKADSVVNLRDATLTGTKLYLLGGDNKIWTLDVQ